MPEVVSGYDIIQAADAGPNCRHRTCIITYRWQQIPNTLGPTHEVGHVDSYQVAVQQIILRKGDKFSLKFQGQSTN